MDLLFALAHLAKLALLTALLCEIAARTGSAGIDLVGYRSNSARMRFGLGLILGWMLIGTAFLGMALTGLFRPFPLLAAAMLPAAMLFRRNRARSLTLAAAREWFQAGSGIAIPGVVALVFITYWMVPDTEHDVLVYHLAAPHQWLLAGRAFFDHVSVNFHLSLPVEMTFAIPLILGDDRLAKWIVASFLLAAASVWTSRNDPDSWSVATWLGPLLALSLTSTFLLLTRSKNDLPAAAIFLAAVAISSRRGTPTANTAGMGAPAPATGEVTPARSVVGVAPTPARSVVGVALAAFLFGCAGAAKYTCAPAIAAWLLFDRTFHRRPYLIAGILLAPVLPWLAKAWLTVGNPFFPFLFDTIPTLGWNARNIPVRLAHIGPLWDAGNVAVLSLLPSYIVHITREHFLLPLAIVICLIRRNHRLPTIALVVGGAAILYLGHMRRFAYPATLALAFIAVDELVHIPWLQNRVRTSMLALACLLPLTLALYDKPPPVADAIKPRSLVRMEQLGTFGTLAAHSDRRLILVGESRIYPLPRRIVYAGALYETPLIWKLTREAYSPARLRIRFRQLGSDTLAYNFVSAQTSRMNYWPVPWDERQLKLYRTFMRLYASFIDAPSRVDQRHGGFCIYRLASNARQKPSVESLFFLPGAESVLTPADEALVIERNRTAAIALYRAAVKKLPDVGMARSRLANALHGMGKYREAYTLMRPFVKAGMIDDTNLSTYGTSALALGKPAEAIAVLERAYELYPHQRANLALHLKDARERLSKLR